LRYLDRLQPLALLVLRLVLGAIMIGHSYTKVFGGEHRYVGYITSIGLPWWSAYLSIAAEFGGGILLIVGLLTRFAALTLVIDMAVAIAKIHFKNGLLGENGYQFPMSLAAIGVALIFFGAGPISLDSVRGGGRSFSSNRK